MCTWMVVESVGYFLRNDSEVFATFMEMKKAFDMVNHSLVFKKLRDRNLPPIFTRLLIVMYISETAKVKWGNQLSDSFPITSGVKQGAFCICIRELIKQFRRNRTGCWVNVDFVGVIVYADDIVLLSRTLDGLQGMIRTCSTYAKNHEHDNPRKNKTKCMAFLKKKRKLKNLALDAKKLPWINSLKHHDTT